MRIKRFFCSDMRSAIRKVSEELGPDAVILSNVEVDGGVEIAAAVDYDEAWMQSAGASGAAAALQASPRPEAGGHEPSAAAPERRSRAGSAPEDEVQVDAAPALACVGEELRSLRQLLEQQLSGLAWGELARRYPTRAAAFRRLLGLGLSRELAGDLCERVDPGLSDPSVAWRRVLGLLAHRVPILERDLLNEGGVYAVLGATGVGKTTTIAKLAARFALRHGASEVALVTTDSYRVGAHEQLRTFAQIMGIPVRVAVELGELRDALEHYAERRLVLIDTAGISQRDRRFAEQINLVHRGASVVRMLLALSATSQHRAMEEAVEAFGETELDACVITKLDEATSLGAVLSVVCERAIPVAFVSNGQRVPEDIASARAHLLVTRAVTLAQSADTERDGEGSSATYGGLEANAGY